MTTTPLDGRIAEARAAIDEHEKAIERAHVERSRWLAESEPLMEQAKYRPLGEKEKNALEELRSKYDGAVADYLRSDTLRLRERARLTALEAVRERHLLEVHGIFPGQSLYSERTDRADRQRSD